MSTIWPFCWAGASSEAAGTARPREKEQGRTAEKGDWLISFLF